MRLLISTDPKDVTAADFVYIVTETQLARIDAFINGVALPYTPRGLTTDAPDAVRVGACHCERMEDNPIDATMCAWCGGAI